jgi:hypothetical protein
VRERWGKRRGKRKGDGELEREKTEMEMERIERIERRYFIEEFDL